MIDTRIRTSAAALAASAALLLTGCGILPAPAPSGGPSQSQAAPDPTQSQAQQCAQVIAEVESIAADVGRVGEMIGTDPLGALALVGGISGRVGDLQTQVSDPELLQRIGEIQAGWDAIVEDAQGAITSGDAAGLERAITGLTELGQQVSSLQEFCAGTE